MIRANRGRVKAWQMTLTVRSKLYARKARGTGLIDAQTAQTENWFETGRKPDS